MRLRSLLLLIAVAACSELEGTKTIVFDAGPDALGADAAVVAAAAMGGTASPPDASAGTTAMPATAGVGGISAAGAGGMAANGGAGGGSAVDAGPMVGTGGQAGTAMMFQCVGVTMERSLPKPALEMGTGEIAKATGGAIADGTYRLTKITNYSMVPSFYTRETIQLAAPYFRRSFVGYGLFTNGMGVMKETEYNNAEVVGTFAATGTLLAMSGSKTCIDVNNHDVTDYSGSYTVTGNKLILARDNIVYEYTRVP